MLTLLTLTILITLLIDKLNVTNELYRSLLKFFRLASSSMIVTKSIGKPFDCSLCLTFWLTLIYQLLVVTKSILNVEINIIIYNLMISMLLAFSTKYISLVFDILDYWIIKLLNYMR